MSCMYCIHYVKLNEYCHKDIMVNTGNEAFDCMDYQYNKKVRINDDM